MSLRRLLFLALPLWALTLASCAPGKTPKPVSTDGYLFCFWNAENFFDDKLDNHAHEPDKTYDDWFANDPAVLKQKLDNLTGALLKMNNGAGPDILALAECESQRSVELLRDHLNARLENKDLHYRNILYKDPKGGRSIATAILTRLDVDRSKTKLHGRRLRRFSRDTSWQADTILTVLASHWTSRLTDKTGKGRDKYADLIYSTFEAAYKENPKTAFLVCGDFNDPPDADSVLDHLHAIGDEEKVKAGAGSEGPFLLDLMARPELIGKKPRHGTHNYRGTWFTFDQICVSPGLLDRASWSCDPATMKIENELTAFPAGRNKGNPHRFGDKDDGTRLENRGYSDHFPVTVRLRVRGNSE